MRTRLLRWWPEIVLSTVSGYFIFRELGTFPAAWADDSLFMIVAREIAAGRGYALPILEKHWFYPYTLGVGPTLILPVAFAARLLGFSIAVARLPMAGFLLATLATFYCFTLRIAGRSTARWSTALLVTLSAFVNTGKPVLGEIPALLFLLLGLFLLQRKLTTMRSVMAGFFLGLAVLTKISFGLLYPAVGIVWLCFLLRRQWSELRQCTIMGTAAVAVFLPWRIVEFLVSPGIIDDILFLWGKEQKESVFPFSTLLESPSTLLRLPFLAFCIILLAGSLGFWKIRASLAPALRLIVPPFILLVVFYFGSSFLWYRHLLPAHVLLLPFVPIGLQTILKKRFADIALIAIVVLQGIWQFDYRGASKSAEEAGVADAIVRRFSEKPLIIQQAEIFVRLPENPRWLFLTNPLLTRHIPAPFGLLSATQRCLPVLRKFGGEEFQDFRERAQGIGGRYFVIAPPATC